MNFNWQSQMASVAMFGQTHWNLRPAIAYDCIGLAGTSIDRASLQLRNGEII